MIGVNITFELNMDIRYALILYQLKSFFASLTIILGLLKTTQNLFETLFILEIIVRLASYTFFGYFIIFLAKRDHDETEVFLVNVRNFTFETSSIILNFTKLQIANTLFI